MNSTVRPLSNKNYLIVGATSDIGTLLSRTLADLGATCILMDKNVNQLEKLYDTIEANGAPKPAIYPFDRLSANPDHYADIPNHISEHFDCLDGIIFSEGAFVGLTPLLHYDIKKWYSVLQVNLNAPFMLCKALIPQLKKAGKSHILFTSGVSHHEGKAYWGAHRIADQGLVGLVEVLNDELEYCCIHAKIIRPGPIRCAQRLKAYPAENPLHLPELDSILPLYLQLLIPDLDF